MLKFAILFAFIFLHCSSVLGQDLFHILTLHRDDDLSYIAPLQTMGVYVDSEKLTEVSNSILMAENWLRTHVLSYYPSRNINTIVVANDVLCNDGMITKNQEEIVTLTLNSMKNLYHSLIRWGLDREIKVSVSLSSNCLQKSHLKPVFAFLEMINSTYTITPPQISDQIVRLLVTELKSMNDMNDFRSETMNVLIPAVKQMKFASRKLSFIDDLWSTSTPPSPVVEVSPAPTEIQPPAMAPASSPSPYYGFNLPPCNPYTNHYHAVPPVIGNGGSRTMAAPPMAGGSISAPLTSGGEDEVELWCVAKPSVPSEKLQEAMDYACGGGGADCGPIRPNGSCFSPDSVVAHASYAFNSYWQKNKKNGGICGFEGTAMLISSDPSYLHCHFVLG